MSEKPRPFFYRLIERTVDFFYPSYEVLGAENLPEEACILVGNHSRANGPICAQIRFPRKSMIWCVSSAMSKDRKEVAAYMFSDFWSQKPKSVLWFYRLLSKLFSGLLSYVLFNANTIPVYHDRKIITTFRESMSALQEGKDIVIFPESYTAYNSVVYRFQPGFVDLAKLCERRTKKPVFLVPVYLAPKLKKIVIGKPIAYDPAVSNEQVCEALMDGITGLAQSMPLHKVVPYPNYIPAKNFPYNKEADQN